MRTVESALDRRLAPQRGFSMIETMIVLAILGILVNLAVPVYVESRLRAQAAAIAADYRVVQTAVSDYYLANQAWPQNVAAGIQPPELDEFLSDQIDWAAPAYTYDYDYFADVDGTPTQPESGVLVGFSVRNADDRLVSVLQATHNGLLTETWGDGVTFVIQAPDTDPPAQ
jgi:prepilin-type N-terminal cleavage/methylation domain-containing protein